ncbi:MAG: trypsin-like peptidase domain-containing protein [Anaerolineales bacterium]|nr:trypsin-like peptidase domain-containing protein [Anaerolineales bacterium]MCB9004624.1 trypsin-like peptidase domain-containing protein [Ardenticatenaceae bacterium]
MSNPLSDFSDALTVIVADAAPGVVRVDARKRFPASGIVWSEDGLIITAHHIVQRDENISVGLADGTAVSATLIGRDPTTDLALLRAEASGLTPIPHAAAKESSVGSFVLALGRPGSGIQATFGIISALGESWRTRAGGLIDQYVQTDVLMYPGFSGGPLVNAQGQLVGLNTSGFGHGVSLTIPTATLQRVADSLLSHGRVKRGYLGVNTQRVRLPEAVANELGRKSGLLVVSVEAGSPAEQGGLMLGDTIMALADTAVRKHDDLLTSLSGDRVGTAVPIQILRGGKLETLTVTIGERA